MEEEDVEKEIADLYKKCTKNWKLLLQSPLTSPNEQEKIEELAQSLQQILEKYEDPAYRSRSPQEIITTAKVKDLLEKFFSQPREERERVLNRWNIYGPVLREFIKDVCSWCSKKARGKAGFLISLVVKTALGGGLRKQKKDALHHPTH
jgi:hypothetical protein